MAQSALERNPDIRFMRTPRLYGHFLYIAPSVSVLMGFNWLDFQDLAGVKGCRPTTDVPSHFQLQSYGPEFL